MLDWLQIETCWLPLDFSMETRRYTTPSNKYATFLGPICKLLTDKELPPIANFCHWLRRLARSKNLHLE